MMLKHADPVHKVTIIPRGRAGGYTLMLPKEDRNYATRSELLDRLKVAMGGRVAEEIVLNEISTGASQDIQQASKIVRSMIMQYGMSEVLGPVAYGNDQAQQFLMGGQNQRNYSEEVASEIDKEVQKYMEEAYDSCRQILKEHRHELDLIAQALIEKETLTAAELKEIVFGKEENQTPLIDLTKNIPEEKTVDLTKREEEVSDSIFTPNNSSPTPV